MEPSNNCFDLIKSFEGFRSHAYQDTGGVWTIGYGTIRYPDGINIKEGDECTPEQALEYLKFDVKGAANTINHLHWDVPLNQNQFDSLVSFQYNTGALPSSTLYKKAKVNPNDEIIVEEFMKWVHDNGRVIQGLINRREREANLYFS